jgi:hypothetical protein
MGILALAVGIGCSLPGFLRHGPPAERALVFVFAGIFALAGLQILTDAKGRAGRLIGSIIVAGLSVMSFTAAFGPGRISGGVPLLPSQWNQHIGKLAFGFFGVIAGMIALAGLWRVAKPPPSKHIISL